MREINVLLAIDRTQASQATYAAVIVRGFIRILSKGTPPSTAKDSEIVQCMYVFQKRPCMPLRWRRWRRRSNSLISISLSRTSIINIELVLYKPTLCSFSSSLRMSGVTLASLARSTTNGDCLILCVAGLVSESPLKWSQVFRVIFYSVSLFSVIVKYCNSIGYMSGISMCSDCECVESLLFKMPSWYIDWGGYQQQQTHEKPVWSKEERARDGTSNGQVDRRRRGILMMKRDDRRLWSQITSDLLLLLRGLLLHTRLQYNMTLN